ncbi:hypothetical protein DPEC_G00088700 [Dallia pectoralis]|uniref:Uncharacterized protein n=1 Tax=Dallia pectoralis TaxID=75939 RepID=A0ACC2H0I2_DALPE|nr:hypothetical protein DPEC_G00088700 [Dallia pectoralis]
MSLLKTLEPTLVEKETLILGHFCLSSPTGTDLHGVSRYQVIQNDNCNATLKVTLRKEDDNRKWTCELTQNGHVKSFDFLVTFPGVKEWVVIRVVIWVVVSVAVFAMITALVVILRKRTKNPKPVDTGNMVNENNCVGENNDITYAVVTVSTGSSVMERDPKTEYATIKTKP